MLSTAAYEVAGRKNMVMIATMFIELLSPRMLVANFCDCFAILRDNRASALDASRTLRMECVVLTSSLSLATRISLNSRASVVLVLFSSSGTNVRKDLNSEALLQK